MLSRWVQCLVGLLCLTTLVSAAAPDTRLSGAAMNGDRAMVQELLKQKVDVNAPQGDGTTALHWAAYRDDIGMTEMLLRAGASVTAKTRVGDNTPLVLAAKNGSAPIILLLLKAGADPNSANATGTTPLMLAAASGSVEAVKVLLDGAAQVNARESAYGQTAIMFAAALNRSEVITLLASRGADMNVVSAVVPLYQKGQAERAQTQDQNQAQAQNRNRNRADRAERAPTTMGGNTALHLAAREGQMAAVKALVEAGADVNQVSAMDKMSAMTTAILNSHFDIGKYLLDHGADPKLLNTGGLGPLYAAIDSEYAQRTWYPPLSTDQEQITHIELMKALIARGADVNARISRDLWFRKFGGGGGDAAGATAFWRAAQANDIEAMKILVPAGADPNIPSSAGVSPLQVAAGFGISHQGTVFVPDARMATIRYLVEELGADVNMKDSRGYTPLHGVAMVGDNEILKYLVARGADVKARASSVVGREEGGDTDVAAGTGDTVADYANGPGMNARVYPDMIALLINLGSEFSDNCRASVCVLKARPDPKPAGQK